MNITFELPIYYYDGKKMMLVGMNGYERMHHFTRDRLKKTYYQLIRAAVGKNQRIKGSFSVHYTLYYKNVQMDAPNVIAAIDKMAMDGLQIIGAIEQDNVKHYISQSWEVGGQDKERPRVEVTISQAQYS